MSFMSLPLLKVSVSYFVECISIWVWRFGMFSHDYVEVMHFWQEHRNALSVSCQGENNILKYHLDFDFLAILPLSSASLLRKHLMA